MAKTVKKITTVADMFTRLDVAEALETVIKKKDHITEILCIYCDDTGRMFSVANDLKASRAVYMMEKIKHDLLDDGE